MGERTELIGARPVMSNVVGYRLYKSTGLIIKFRGQLYSTIYDHCYYLRDDDNNTIDLVSTVPGAIQEDGELAIAWVLNENSDEQVVMNYIHYLQKIKREYEREMLNQINKTNLVIERLTKTLEDLKKRGLV